MRGHIYKTPKGWRAQVDIGPDPVSGKRRRRRFGPFTSKREAQRAAARVLADVAEGRAADPGDLTIEDLLEKRWLPARIARGLKPTTISSYTFLARTYIEPRIGRCRLADFAAANVVDFIVEFASEDGRSGKPRSARTVAATVRVLDMALGDAVRWQLINRNPVDDARADLPRTRNRPDPTAWWTPRQLAAFLASTKNDRMYPLWVLAATTGLRRGELLGLRWDDIDLDSKVVSIRRTRVTDGASVYDQPTAKTESSVRRIALFDETVEALCRHRRSQNAERLAQQPGFWDSDGRVFTDETGRGLSPDYLSKQFRRAVDQSGLPRIRLHDLRHSYASAALLAGIDETVLSRRLGHSSPTVTRSIYLHAGEQQDRDAADRTGKLIFGRTGTDDTHRSP